MLRAAARLADERAAVEARCAAVTGFERDNALLASKLSGVQNQLSNFGDERPVSYCAFAPGGGTCATGGSYRRRRRPCHVRRAAAAV